jgi:hypothetical protein
MCIFHSLEKAKEYVEKKRKLDAAQTLNTRRRLSKRQR